MAARGKAGRQPGGADVIRDMSGGFTDLFQVAQTGVVGKPAGYETGLIEAVRLGGHLSGKVDHVVEVEAPFALAGIRH